MPTYTDKKGRQVEFAQEPTEADFEAATAYLDSREKVPYHIRSAGADDIPPDDFTSIKPVKSFDERYPQTAQQLKEYNPDLPFWLQPPKPRSLGDRINTGLLPVTKVTNPIADWLGSPSAQKAGIHPGAGPIVGGGIRMGGEIAEGVSSPLGIATGGASIGRQLLARTGAKLVPGLAGLRSPYTVLSGVEKGLALGHGGEGVANVAMGAEDDNNQQMLLGAIQAALSLYGFKSGRHPRLKSKEDLSAYVDPIGPVQPPDTGMEPLESLLGDIENKVSGTSRLNPRNTYNTAEPYNYLPPGQWVPGTGTKLPVELPQPSLMEADVPNLDQNLLDATQNQGWTSPGRAVPTIGPNLPTLDAPMPRLIPKPGQGVTPIYDVQNRNLGSYGQVETSKFRGDYINSKTGKVVKEGSGQAQPQNRSNVIYSTKEVPRQVEERNMTDRVAPMYSEPTDPRAISTAVKVSSELEKSLTTRGQPQNLIPRLAKEVEALGPKDTAFFQDLDALKTMWQDDKLRKTIPKDLQEEVVNILQAGAKIPVPKGVTVKPPVNSGVKASLERLNAKKGSSVVPPEATPQLGKPAQQTLSGKLLPQRTLIRKGEETISELDKLEVSEGIREAESAWIGGVGDLGDSEAAYTIQQMPGYFNYKGEITDLLRKRHGETVRLYSAQTSKQYDDWLNGADIGPQAFTTNPGVALRWKNVAANKGEKNFVVVEIDAPVDSVIMRGHPAERELVIDGNQISAHTLRILDDQRVKPPAPSILETTKRASSETSLITGKPIPKHPGREGEEGSFRWPIKGGIPAVNPVTGKRGPTLVEKFEDTVNMFKTLKSGPDISAFRQGIQGMTDLLVEDRTRLKSVLSKTWKSIKSEAEFDRLSLAQKQNPYYQLGMEDGLALTEHPAHVKLGQSPLQREEFWASSIPEKIPIAGKFYRMSNRAFAMGLNDTRLERYMQLIDEFTKLGKIGPGTQGSKQFREDIAKYVNITTGRGGLGKIGETASRLLQATMYSPRLFASRVQSFTHMIPNEAFRAVGGVGSRILGKKATGYYPGKSRTLPKELSAKLVQSNVRAATLTGLILAGIKAAGGKDVKIETNPKSGEFTKLRYKKKTIIDVTMGLPRPATIATKMLTGEQKTFKGGVQPIAQEQGAGPISHMDDVFWRSLWSLAAPPASAAVTVGSSYNKEDGVGKNYIGEDFDRRNPEHWVREGVNMTSPMYPEAVYEVLQQHGLAGLPLAGLAATGIGADVYDPDKPKTGKSKVYQLYRKAKKMYNQP